ncbi:MAG: ExbD/TolR family protein [Bdellovibrionales bacterium]
MHVPSGGKNKKEVNFELNLIPVFDVLSACICFLLITAVWVQIGSMDVSQALGGQATEKKENPPSVLTYMEPTGEIHFSLKDTPGAPAKLKDIRIKGQSGDVTWNQVEQYIQQLSKYVPKVQTALVMPSKQTRYEDMMQIMDQFKKNGLKDIGISPL